MAFSSKPDINSNFFSNYGSHALFVLDKHRKIIDRTPGDASVKGSTLLNLKHECLAKLNFSTPFRDRYDVTDECLGATVLPLAGVLASATLVLWATKELLHELAITFNLVNDDGIEHGTDAISFCVLALVTAAASLAALIKCTLSLLTRTVTTLCDALLNPTTENQDQPEQQLADDEIRFMFSATGN